MKWKYTTQQGDTWDVLAHDIYGSEKLMDVLIEANPYEHPVLPGWGGADRSADAGQKHQNNACTPVGQEVGVFLVHLPAL